MSVVAYTYVYNEEDIIAESVQNVLDQGCDAYVLDNWSTDRTRDVLAEVAQRYPGRVTLERFPADGPPRWFDLASILQRIEALHAELQPEWGLLFGADELLEAPPQAGSVAEFLGRIGSMGYTAVPAVEVVFHPVDDGWKPGVSVRDYFQHWSFGRRQNVRAWMSPVVKFLHGGHDVEFHGRKLWRGEGLILRHYPLRNQAQAERKVFVERRPRYAPWERRLGWHTHYDNIQPGHNFIRDSAGLRKYDQETFYGEVQQWLMC